MDYRQAGVDIAAGNRAVELMRSLVASTRRPEVLGGIGGFGGFFSVPAGYREPVLVAGADGVGTKLKIAFAMGRHDTVGIDCVAMNVNDILTHGAEPLFFLDYLGVGKLDPEQVASVVAGVAEGCRRAGCALLGGETAEMPGFYAPGEYDLAGFAVGVVEKAQLIDGSRARAGDVLLGLTSSGLHSNGFSLVRKVLLEQAGLGLDEQVTELGGRPLGEVLLEPTRIYVPSVLGLLRHLADAGRAGVVHGMAHITGGGLVENVPRALPSGCHAAFEWGNWPIPPVFGLVQRAGNVPAQEMYRVFNMGIGFVLVVDAAAADEVETHLSRAGERVFRIGRVEPTRG